MPTIEALFQEMSDISPLRLEHGSLTSNYQRVCLLPENNNQIRPFDLRIGYIAKNQKDATSLKALTANSPSAIGYLLAKRDDSIPNILVKKAKTENITLFSIPPDATAGHLKNLALKLVLTTEDASLLSYAQLTEKLLATLKSHKPERHLLNTLHTLTDGSFLLLSSDNRTLASSGSLRIPKARLLNLTEGSYPLQIRDSQYSANLFHIHSDNTSTHNVFIAVLHQASHLGLIENAVSMLSLIQEKQEAEIQRRSIQKEAFLSEWFANSFSKASFKHQLSDMGFDETATYAIAVVNIIISSNTQSRQQLGKTSEDIQLSALNFFDSLSLSVLSNIRPKYQIFPEESTYTPHIIFVFSGANAKAQLEPLHQAISVVAQETECELQLGLSQESNNYTAASLKNLYEQAQQAAQEAKNAPVQFHKPEAFRWILSDQSSDKLQSIADSILKPIQEADKSGKLIDTLLAYLDKPTNLDQLASNLDIHLNTLRYRLKKIETLTGKLLSNPKNLAEFYLVTEIIKLRDDESN